MTGKVLTIAGSDCSGGAGIQADIKTITMHGCYAMSVITALTAQNTTGVSGIFDVIPEFVAQQFDAVFTDIFPDAVKIGMVSNAEIIHIIAEKLREYAPKNIVADPVMISTSGYRLIEEEAAETLINELLPLAALVTPNIPEAEALSGMEINSTDDMKLAAVKLSSELNTAVLVKGGHLDGKAVDILCEKDGKLTFFESERIETQNTHGTGCTLSSAIASNLAKGMTMLESVGKAKEYLSGALAADFDLGKGNGPLKHFYLLDK
ncbi:MAG: bifunctional hydroxymethylpyrimidine kinase/phosphomethylpyrimidine kinase [Ruminococcus sp.]|nr:bifunctional hydroxymethylpyrimidine kinase/phosphomethylpyrimidine kinase [Ruminococcus sp.]